MHSLVLSESVGSGTLYTHNYLDMTLKNHDRTHNDSQQFNIHFLVPFLIVACDNASSEEGLAQETSWTPALPVAAIDRHESCTWHLL